MLKSLTVVLVVVFLSAPALAQSWLAGDGNWADGAKWSGGVMPGLGNNPYLTRAATATINSDVGTVNGINVWSGMTIQMDTDGVLGFGNLTGNLQLGLHGANVGDLGTKGTFIQNAGSVIATGSSLLYLGSTTTGKGGSAEYQLNGGTIDVPRLRLGPSASGQAGYQRIFIQEAGTSVIASLGGGVAGKNLEIGYNAEYQLKGGLLDAGNGRLEVRAAGNFVWTGGTLQGVAAVTRDGFVNQNGAGSMFKVGADVAAASTTHLGNAAGLVGGVGANWTTTAGTVEFDVSANGVNDTFTVDAATILDLSSVNAVVDVNFGAYAPQVGDSWDFVDNIGGTATLSAANVAPLGVAGLSWDTSAWVSDGVLTVVPEPATMSLLILGGCAVLARRRRK